MRNVVSKRAKILKRVLKYINADDFQNFGDHMVFGMESKQTKEYVEHLGAGLDFELLQKFLEDLARLGNNRLSQERTSLKPRPDDEALFKQLDANAKGTRSRLVVNFWESFRDALRGGPPKELSSVLSNPQIDALDDHYAQEMLGKLEKIVSRASRLQKLELKSFPNSKVNKYFEEAHRCYLYGFSVACAVMCRAILESALKETIDPKGELRPKEPGESHVLKMINKAKIYRRLSDPLPQWAEEAKKAGDNAVHDVEAFERDYPVERLEDVLCKARKVVESLYGAPASRVQSDPCNR